MRVLRRAWLGLVVMMFAGCGGGAPVAPPPVVVKVQTIAAGAESEGPRYSGSVVPSRRVDLAFRYGGYVDELLRVEGRPVQDGDRVNAGAVLARVRQSDYLAKLEQARSQVTLAEAGIEQARNGARAAQAGLDKARADLTRASSLYKATSLTRSDLDAATAAADAAQATFDGATAQVAGATAQLAGARAQLQEAELALADTAIRAPMDALVVRTLVEVGTLVGPGTGAFVVADATRLNVAFAAPDTLLPQIPLGTTLAMTTDALGPTRFSGTVTKVSPAADPKSRAFDVELAVVRPDRRLKLGMITTIHVPAAPATPRPVVPLAAVVPAATAGRYAVYVVTRQGDADVPKQREIELGEAVGNAIAVVSGLTIGERVVVVGAPLVRDGQAVTIVP